MFYTEQNEAKTVYGKEIVKKEVKQTIYQELVQMWEEYHYKSLYPNKEKEKEKKKIAMTILEVMLMELASGSQWFDFITIRHIRRNRELFVNLGKKQTGEHRVYMGNNIYYDVLGQYTCKFKIHGSIILLSNVLYVPCIRKNLVSVLVLDQKGYIVEFKFEIVYYQ